MLGYIFIQNFSRINTPTFLKPSHFHTYLPMKMEQSVPKRRHIKFRRWGITHKKAYNKFSYFYGTQRFIAVIKKNPSTFCGPVECSPQLHCLLLWALLFCHLVIIFLTRLFPCGQTVKYLCFFYLETAEQLRPKRFIQRRFERRTPGMKHCKSKAI